MSVPRRLSPILLLGLASAMGMSTVEAEDRSGRPAAKPLPRTESAAPKAKSGEASSFITFKNGQLDARVQNQSLRWALEQISRQSGVPIVSATDLGRELLSIRFEKLSLEEGLRRILKGHDVFVFLGADEKAPGALKAVWVYPKGQGRWLMPLPPETATKDLEISADLNDPNPTARARALEVLVDRRGQQSLPAVLQALKDSDDTVRWRGLHTALESGIVLPPDTLQNLVRSDASPLVRYQAMEAIANLSFDNPEVARTMAEFALSDPDPHVREQARSILELASQPQGSMPSQEGQEGTQASNIEAASQRQASEEREIGEGAQNQ